MLQRVMRVTGVHIRREWRTYAVQRVICPARCVSSHARGLWYIVVHLLTPMWLNVGRHLGLPQSDLLCTTVLEGASLRLVQDVSGVVGCGQNAVRAPPASTGRAYGG